MKLRFGWTPVPAILAEPNITDLLRAYWEELSPHKGELVLDPDFGRMVHLEALGIFRVWTAHSPNRLLIGFIGFHIQPHLNYRTSLFAFDAGHYLDPMFRSKGWIGIRMWRTAMIGLREMGVKIVISHDNELLPLPGFFRRLGFQRRGSIYWRSLTDAE